MADNGLMGDSQAIGVSFDGTGYGEDGAIWGGEFLLADYRDFRRFAHLAYTPLPGGDAAVRKPARTALAYLWQAGLDWDSVLPSVQALCVEERQALRSQLERQLNAPLASSMGRLFDAVAALTGIRQQVNYEAQAAIELEAIADPYEKAAYHFAFVRLPERPLQVQSSPVITAVLEDVLAGVPISQISARFHNGIAHMVLDVCQAARKETGIKQVALSGGVWQNMTLLLKSVSFLKAAGFEVLLHNQVPPNDGGLALGQAVIAATRTHQI
jgi:hydrogenase maturation protein HypF